MGRTSKKAELEQAHLAAKIRATEARAEKTRLETRQRAGELVERQEVEMDAAETAVAIIRAMEQVPARCAGLCVGQPAEAIARIVRTEIMDALEALRASAYARKADGIPERDADVGDEAQTATVATEAKPKRRRGRPAAH